MQERRHELLTLRWLFSPGNSPPGPSVTSGSTIGTRPFSCKHSHFVRSRICKALTLSYAYVTGHLCRQKGLSRMK